jgi:protein TonB
MSANPTTVTACSGRRGGVDRAFAPLVLISLAVHLAAGLWLNASPFQPARYAMQPPLDSLDVAFVELIEPPPPLIQPQPEPVIPPEPEPAPPEPEILTLPEPEPDVPPQPQTPPPPLPQPAAPVVVQTPPEPAPLEPPADAAPPPPEPIAITEAKPDYLRNPPPPYPRIARQRGWQGTTILKVEVLPNGLAGHIEILRTSGHRVLDEISVETVRGWKFLPARRGDAFVPSWVEIPIRFTLLSG